MTTAIRTLEAGDIPALQRLDRRAHGEAWSHQAFVDQIDGAHFTHLVAVDDDGRPIAHAASWLDGTTLRVTNVACDPDVTGRGLATGLLLELLSRAAGPESVAAISLEVRPGNRRAQRLYSRFGFAPSGVTRDFYERRDTAGSRDALVMRIGDPSSPTWQRRLDSIARDSSLHPTPGVSP